MNINKLFESARGRITKRETFFSKFKECDIHLTVVTHGDGSTSGQVWTEDGCLYFGTGKHCERFFYSLHADEEAHYAIVRAQARAAGLMP